MITVGLVGAGPWARAFQAPMLARAEDLAFTALWARRVDAADVLAAEHGVVVAPSFAALLDACDAIAFAVPPSVQAVLAGQAAAAGKHLLLEKPIAATLVDAEGLAAAVTAAGVASLVLLRNRFGRPVQRFLEACGASTVRTAACTFVSDAVLPGSRFATPWRVAEPHALLDLGPHALDLVDAAAGPITGISASASGGVLHLTTQHASGATGSVVLSAVTPGSNGPLTCLAVTDAGLVRLDDPDAQPETEVQRAITDAFARAVRGEPSPIDVHRGVAVQRLLAAAAESLGSGRAASPTGPTGLPTEGRTT
jgi:predicted dehydrogenase